MRWIGEKSTVHTGRCHYGTDAGDYGGLYVLKVVKYALYSDKNILCSSTILVVVDAVILLENGVDALLQAHADVLGVPIIVPHCDESVALGSAILASVAADRYPSLREAMLALGQSGTVFYPREELRTFHTQKYRKFRDLGDFMSRFK